jgi:internalin A
MRPMSVLTLAIAFAVCGNVSAQAKPTQKQIDDAVRAFQAATCSLRYEKIVDPMNPGVVKLGPVDMIAMHDSATDADMAKLIPLAVKAFPNLKSIDFFQNSMITEVGYAHLKKFKNLQALYFDGSSLGNAGMAEIANVPGLRILDISGTQVTDAGLAAVKNMESLTHLMMERLPGVTERGIGEIAKCPTLRILEITMNHTGAMPNPRVGRPAVGIKPGVKPAELPVPLPATSGPTAMAAAIAEMGLISELVVSGATDSDADYFARMKGLNVLRIGYNWESESLDDRSSSYNSITDTGLRSISKATGLRVLDVSGNRFTARGLADITKLANLEELNLSFTSINDASMDQVVKLKHLTYLNVSNTNVTQTGIIDLAKLPALTKLHIAGNDIGDEALHQIARLKVLKVLNAAATRVSCKSYHDVSGLVNLDTLNLSATNLTEQSLKPLSTLKNLKLLDIRYNCPNITPEMGMRLKGEMPKTNLLYSSCKTCWCGAEGYPFRVNAPRSTSPRSTTTVNSPRTETIPPKMAPPIRTGGPATGTGIKP